MSEEEIKQLIIEAKDGNNESFGKIYSFYLSPIYRYIYFRVGDKNIAEDLTQDVFLKVFNSLGSFDISKSFPLSYFYTVARNLIIDVYRKKNISTLDVEIIEDVLFDDKNPEVESILNEDARNLRLAMKEISGSEAEVLIFKFLQNYSNKEISQIMNKSEDAIRQLQSRGIKSLREVMEKKGFS